MTLTDERVLPAAAPALDREQAFRQLIESDLDASYRLATVLLGDRNEAEDATHDAVVRAWRSFGSLRSAESFRPWFQRILVNTCRDRMRRRRWVRVSFAESHDGYVGDAQVRTGERDALERALSDLSADQRVVIVLRYYLDLPIEEIATRLGSPSGTVKSRLHHAIRALRAAYDAGARTRLEGPR